jgi:hypothetical protein
MILPIMYSCTIDVYASLTLKRQRSARRYFMLCLEAKRLLVITGGARSPMDILVGCNFPPDGFLGIVSKSVK